MSKELQPFEVPRVSRDPLDEVKVGDWYWVHYEKSQHEPEHEHLFCVEEIGSNFIGFTASTSHDGSYSDRIHFNEFMARCRPEPHWREVLQKKMDGIQKAIQEKTKQLVAEGQKLYLIAPPQELVAPAETKSLLPVKVADEPKRYKQELIKLKDKTLPAISKEIDELAKDFAVTAKDMALPDLVRLGVVKEVLGKVEDKIFTIELYCGLQEEVVQIAEGEPATASEKIAIRQAMLFMDEETLFDYEDGGMDFKRIKDFDRWVVKPENLNRIMPELKGIVAFRVRRHDKEYESPSTILQAWTQMEWKEANQQTYLLIRNGGNVWRIASEIDFSPRLIPKRNEIGAEQFKKINERWVWNDGKEDKILGVAGERVVTEEMVTPDSVEFDDHVKKVDALLKQYNRIVILIQGLLDRSMVFHPHPPINLTIPGVLDEWVRLIRDEEDGLPSNRVTWEEYQKQLNSTLRKGKWVYIDSAYDEGYKDGEKPYREGSRYREESRRRGWAANKMPDVCCVDSMKRDGSAVRVSWPWGKTSTPRSRRFIESPERPGWGHYESDYETDRMCHEWVPVNRVLNVSDYNLGDYKMFLCDRALRGEYLAWAKYLLTAEDWQRNRAKGIPPEKDKKAQVRP